MRDLELLAPARDAEIGIAAIDCGADAVYIAGPAFGARYSAGNPMEDIRRLCTYAHRFGVRIFLTVNTILFDSELNAARDLLSAAQDAGVDAFIVQDPAVLSLAREAGVTLPMHASTQFSIRTPERARFAESLGFSRLVLERQLSLDGIRAIRAAVGAEIECFVHGALCVCYSGQCYLSEYLSGRSANRGVCAQACRSLYDLADEDGKILVRNKALLSLKDLNLIRRLGELAEAGADSFKIEGRLKNVSYVRNTVRAYSNALDALVAAHPETYRRASFGRVEGGFDPDLEKTFHRDYTELYIDGQRGPWAAMEAPKGMGQAVGTVVLPDNGTTGPFRFRIRPASPGVTLRNGDGFSFVARNGEIVGFRGDLCDGLSVRCKPVPELFDGAMLYRNLDAGFERTLDRQPCVRVIRVETTLDLTPEGIAATAVSEDGRTVSAAITAGERADNPERMRALVRNQFSRRSGHYAFAPGPIRENGPLPLCSAAALNALRRTLAEKLDAIPCRPRPMGTAVPAPNVQGPAVLTYKDNVANETGRQFYAAAGAQRIEPAYELSHRPGVELMRTKYCIRHELGLCLRDPATKHRGALFLLNNGRRLPLSFDCKSCEMAVLDEGDHSSSRTRSTSPKCPVSPE